MMAQFCMIRCVVNMGDASKALKAARKYGIKGATVSVGRGTVRSHFLDILGLNEVRKEIVSILVEDDQAADIIKGVSEDMHFNRPNHGIAFSYSVTEVYGSDNFNNANITKDEVKNSVYQVIHVIVDRGKGGDVIDAANKAGARGGTILHARGSGIHEVQKLFSIEVEPEKDEVFIIAKSELKDSIVNAVRTDMRLDEPGKGILFVVDVNEVYGLHEG